MLCNTLIYGHGVVPGIRSVQLPRLIERVAQDWPLDAAKEEWGYEMASYALGSNSRVRSKYTRSQLGWQPRRTSVVDWITGEMVAT